MALGNPFSNGYCDDAQPFHQEDLPRQAGSSLSCQTLGFTNTLSSHERFQLDLPALPTRGDYH